MPRYILEGKYQAGWFSINKYICKKKAKNTLDRLSVTGRASEYRIRTDNQDLDG